MSTKTNIDYFGFIDSNNERLKILGNYDGSNASIDIKHNKDGINDHYILNLDNNDIRNILGIQPVLQPLEQRLIKDFNVPVSLEGIFKRKKRRHKISKKHINKRNKTTHKKYYL
jgi:hypothetical protein